MSDIWVLQGLTGFQMDYTGTFYSVYQIPKVVWKKVKHD